MAFFIGRAGQITGKLPLLPDEGIRRRWLHHRPRLVVLDIHESHFPDMLLAIPLHGTALRHCAARPRPRGHRMEQAGGEAHRPGQTGRQPRPRAPPPGLSRANGPPPASSPSSANTAPTSIVWAGLCLTPEESAGYLSWIERARREMAGPSDTEAAGEIALATADREDDLLRWLTAHHIPEPWNIAPALAEVRVSLSRWTNWQTSWPPRRSPWPSPPSPAACAPSAWRKPSSTPPSASST